MVAFLDLNLKLLGWRKWVGVEIDEGSSSLGEGGEDGLSVANLG